MSDAWFSPPYVNGIRVWERPYLLKSTRQVYLVEDPLYPKNSPWVVCWSLQVLRILMAPGISGVTFAAWHDEPLNCATWTDAAGCRCEVEP